VSAAVQSEPISRRAFLGKVAAGACAVGLGQGGRLLADPPPGYARVVEVDCERVAKELRLRKSLVAHMLEQALNGVCHTASAGEAWSKLLRPDDVVGIKFNHCGASELATNDTLAKVLVESLAAADVAPERIVLIEVPDRVAAGLGTTAPVHGWQPAEQDFGSGRDRLAAVLDQVTALISVPLLKTHVIAGVTGALKNLSHALVQHPRRYHGNGCSPFIGDIVALPAIRDKLRLSISNAMRCVIDRGPEVSSANTAAAGILLASTDPVALDSVGVLRLTELRGEHGLQSPDLDPLGIRYLVAAGRAGLGQPDPDQIRVKSIRV
jgi:hypothetical protein